MLPKWVARIPVAATAEIRRGGARNSGVWQMAKTRSPRNKERWDQSLSAGRVIKRQSPALGRVLRCRQGFEGQSCQSYKRYRPSRNDMGTAAPAIFFDGRGWCRNGRGRVRNNLGVGPFCRKKVLRCLRRGRELLIRAQSGHTEIQHGPQQNGHHDQFLPTKWSGSRHRRWFDCIGKAAACLLPSPTRKITISR